MLLPDLCRQLHARCNHLPLLFIAISVKSCLRPNQTLDAILKTRVILSQAKEKERAVSTHIFYFHEFLWQLFAHNWWRHIKPLHKHMQAAIFGGRVHLLQAWCGGKAGMVLLRCRPYIKTRSYQCTKQRAMHSDHLDRVKQSIRTLILQYWSYLIFLEVLQVIMDAKQNIPVHVDLYTFYRLHTYHCTMFSIVRSNYEQNTQNNDFSWFKYTCMSFTKIRICKTFAGLAARAYNNKPWYGIEDKQISICVLHFYWKTNVKRL